MVFNIVASCAALLKLVVVAMFPEGGAESSGGIEVTLS